jgi:hypothetical protein
MAEPMSLEDQKKLILPFLQVLLEPCSRYPCSCPCTHAWCRAMQRAQEIQAVDAKVAYYCRFHALQQVKAGLQQVHLWLPQDTACSHSVPWPPQSSSPILPYTHRHSTGWHPRLRAHTSTHTLSCTHHTSTHTHPGTSPRPPPPTLNPPPHRSSSWAAPLPPKSKPWPNPSWGSWRRSAPNSTSSALNRTRSTVSPLRCASSKMRTGWTARGALRWTPARPSMLPASSCRWVGVSGVGGWEGGWGDWGSKGLLMLPASSSRLGWLPRLALHLLCYIGNQASQVRPTCPSFCVHCARPHALPPPPPPDHRPVQ